mgnify:CR=1 FL=1
MPGERRVPDEELAGMRADILASVADCGRRQVAAGIGAEPDGTAHHVVGQYAHLDAFLAALHLDAQISRFFGGAPYILHAFNPVTVGPSRSTYLHNIHRDVRTHAGSFRMLINMLVMVDPFTLENGATYMLSGSHRNPNTPDEALFHQDAERLVGPAGTIVLFDSNLWHAAGQNVPGVFSNLQVLSNGSSVDGATFDKGHYKFSFEVGGSSLGGQTGESGPLPQAPSGGGITLDTSGPESAYVFPIDIPVDPTVKSDVNIVFELNTHENFRWQDEASPDYQTGVFDVTPTTFEPVKSFGANSFRVFAEL